MNIRNFLQLTSLLALLLVATTSYGQSGNSTVRGTVRDPNGNLVSGANVTLTNPERNFTRTQTTNEDGAYVFNGIPPGTYKLEVAAQGFTAGDQAVAAVRWRERQRESKRLPALTAKAPADLNQS